MYMFEVSVSPCSSAFDLSVVVRNTSSKMIRLVSNVRHCPRPRAMKTRVQVCIICTSRIFFGRHLIGHQFWPHLRKKTKRLNTYWSTRTIEQRRQQTVPERSVTFFVVVLLRKLREKTFISICYFESKKTLCQRIKTSIRTSPLVAEASAPSSNPPTATTVVCFARTSSRRSPKCSWPMFSPRVIPPRVPRRSLCTLSIRARWFPSSLLTRSPFNWPEIESRRRCFSRR